MSRLQDILEGSEVYVIAEAGVNHNGDAARAIELVDTAAAAGADAVKFQLFDPEELASPDAPKAEYQNRTAGSVTQMEMLKGLVLPHETYRDLVRRARERGIDSIVTPFDAASARFLAEAGVDALKIPSGEITNLPFLEEVAALGLFTILSTGMSTLDEVRAATEPFRNIGVPFALLHCVSCYPAPEDQIHLRAMEILREEFSVPVGFSDHTEGIAVPLAAAALGARIIEKHFTLDRSLPGPDQAASLEPGELAAMIRGIRTVTRAVGRREKRCQPCEENVRDVARRSLVLRRPVRRGERIAREDIAIQRPGTGLPPAELPSVLGRTAARDLPAGGVLRRSDLS